MVPWCNSQSINRDTMDTVLPQSSHGTISSYAPTRIRQTVDKVSPT
jgi:hypothetical protein